MAISLAVKYPIAEDGFWYLAFSDEANAEKPFKFGKTETSRFARNNYVIVDARDGKIYKATARDKDPEKMLARYKDTVLLTNEPLPANKLVYFETFSGRASEFTIDTACKSQGLTRVEVVNVKRAYAERYKSPLRMAYEGVEPQAGPATAPK